ncbi:hypothetical protein BZG36_02047 [Bifiguratus adelaidae]|uniref:Uncharacterized protein n=1 Tax=Bifiguratus adelaidae TaxID=1938954 RepID=A0A261Y1Z3_9FUNG|nr:hypothetical protein BZG36_02047 [Bifiguratus adelaidae]
MANIGTDASHFFQSDASIEEQKRRAAKVNYDLGDAIKCPSKVLAMTLNMGKSALYLAEAGHVARRINLQTRMAEAVFKGHTGPVTCIATWVDANGREYLFTGSWDKTIRQWDVETLECVYVYAGHADFVKHILIHNSAIYSASSDCTIRLTSISTHETIRILKGHTRPVECLAMSDNGTLYSAGSDRVIRRWNTQTGESQELIGHETSVIYIQLHEDEMWSASADKTAKRWDLTQNSVDTTLDHPDYVKYVLRAGGYVITACRDERIRVWDVGTGHLIANIDGHFDEVTSLQVVGSTLYSGSLDATIRSWKLTTQALKEYHVRATQPQKAKATSHGMTAEEEAELAELLDDV